MSPVWRTSAAVVLVHAGLLAWLWSAQPPLSHPMGEQRILASVVAELPTPPTPLPQPRTQSPTPRPSLQPTVLPAPRPATASPVATPAPAHPEPSPAATSNTAPAVPAAAPTVAAAAAAAIAGSPRPATASAAMVLPSSDADYLNNPPPAYPRMSRRMGEQGTVLLRVFISAEGRAEHAEVRSSSGYARLDEAALETVKRWRYVPGKRAGQAEAMWFNVPIRFVLD